MPSSREEMEVGPEDGIAQIISAAFACQVPSSLNSLLVEKSTYVQAASRAEVAGFALLPYLNARDKPSVGLALKICG
jgi:hypothetical protein